MLRRLELGKSWMRRYIQTQKDRQYKGDWSKKPWIWRYRVLAAVYWRGKRYD